MTRAMPLACFLVTGAMLLGSKAASAWCPVWNGGPGNANDYYAFQVEDSSADWIATVDSPTLSTTTTSPLYWRDVMRHLVDAGAQAWSRDGRVRVKIGYRGLIAGPPGAPGLMDGRSVVYAEPCPLINWPPAQAYTVYDGAGNPGSCDIVFYYGDCSTYWLTPNAAANGTDATHFSRTIRHELAHCVGLDHPAQSDAGCDDYGNCGCALSRCQEDINACTAGQLACGRDCNRITERPLFDDIAGHHVKINNGGPPRREVVFGMATVSSANSFSDQETLNLIGGSIYPARIDCRRGTSTPDCVLVRSHNTGTLKFDRITFAATSPLMFSSINTTTVDYNYITRSPDVALGDAGVSVVVSNRSVGTNLYGVEALRFDTATGSYLSVTQVDASGNNDLTTHEARVVFVRGLGGTGRFVAALPRRDRGLKFFVSSDATGAGPWVMLAANANNGMTGVIDTFDFHCPRHQTPGSGDSTNCAIVLSSDSQNMQNGAAQTCQLSFTTTSVTVSQCRGPFTSQQFATPVALVDYGSGAPSSQRTSTSWLMSLSRQSPDVSGGNSHLRVYSNDRTFPDSAIVVQDEYDMDFLGCSSFGLGDDAQSYFGGTSIDYCEFCGVQIAC